MENICTKKLTKNNTEPKISAVLSTCKPALITKSFIFINGILTSKTLSGASFQSAPQHNIPPKADDTSVRI